MAVIPNLNRQGFVITAISHRQTAISQAKALETFREEIIDSLASHGRD